MRFVGEEKFQEDLFYRIDGVKLRVPPLRERLDDVPELVEAFLGKHSQAMGKRVSSASSETIRLLMSAQWKGNVRQLDNAIERAVMMCETTQIEPTDLPPDLLGLGQPLPDTDDLRSALRHYERLHITRVLRQWPDKRRSRQTTQTGPVESVSEDRGARYRDLKRDQWPFRKDDSRPPPEDVTAQSNLMVASG